MDGHAATISAAALFAALALLATGCGSSHPAAATTAGTTTSSASTGTSTPATTTTGSSGQLGLLTSASCRQLLDLSRSFAQAMAGSLQNLPKTAALVQRFADQAPPEIRPDFQILAADWTKVAAALKGVDLTSGKAPSASVLARLVKLSSQLDAEQLTTASQHIQAWANANCGTISG